MRKLGIMTVAATTLVMGMFAFSNVEAKKVEPLKIGAKFDVPELKLGKDFYVLDAKQADVTGDHLKDNVYSVGKKTKGSEYKENIYVVVQDGKTKKYVKTTDQNLAGYEAKLSLGDVSGDGVKDVMATVPTGGSGGISNHYIASFVNMKPSVLWTEKDNNGFEMDIQYKDGFKADITISALNKSFTLDLSAKKDMYVEVGTYDANGKLLEPVSPFADPIAVVKMEDFGDGMALHAYQSVSGIAHADRITDLETFYKYEKGKWTPVSVTYTTTLK